MIRPVMFTWTDDGVMAPLPRFRALCDRQYAVGEEYALGPVENIPGNSRAPLFIAAKETWNSLPEDDDRFPTPEHLRKRALVRAGWATHAQYVLDTPKDAKALALALRQHDGYAVIRISGSTVEVWTAKSIAAGQISAEEWKVVKERALAFLATVTGVTSGELQRHSRSGGAR